MNSRQALVGAIGGTYISLAVMDIDEFTLGNFALLNSANFISPMQAIERYLKSLPALPDKVALSIAGSVEGDQARMSHLPWTFNKNDILAVTQARHLTFVNEFEALALATPTLTDYDLLKVSDGTPRRYGTRAVISAGTGLGSAGLIWGNERWHPAYGESRLASFPAMIEGRIDIRGEVAADGEVTAGQVLTGRGLVALYEALKDNKGILDKSLTAEKITALGLSGDDSAARQALELMAAWFGRFSGDVALHFGATGGIYLAGGLPAGLAPMLQSDHFRRAFAGNGERHDYLAWIPVHIIKPAADAGLRGAAIALANSLPARATAARQRRA